MRNVTNSLAVMLFCFGLFGCTSHSARLPVGTLHNPSNPETVDILDGIPGQHYEIVGKVHSHCRWNWFLAWAACGEETMLENLRNEAAYLGANALVNVDDTSFSQFEWTDVHYHATAIRK
jgi:hypothetical protein